MLPATWTWVLASHTGQALDELLGQGRSLSFTRNSYAEAKATISHDDAITATLFEAMANGVPQLHCYRQTDDGKALRLTAYLDNLDETAGEGSTVVVTFRDPFALLIGDGSSTGRLTPATPTTFVAEDQGEIAWTLIDNANAEHPTGIARGAVVPTVARDRTYDPNKNKGEAIRELTAVQGGFDFELEYVDPRDREDGALALFNVVPELGQDRPEARFEYGPGTLENVRLVRRRVTPPVNVVRVEGANGVVREARDQASVDKFGEYVQAISATDVTETATLDAKAADALRPEWVRVVEFQPEVGLAPEPWKDCWIGDTVRFNARRGALVESQAPRLNSWSIDLDDSSGAEIAHTLSITEGV